MYCSKCGSNLPSNTAFCPSCGTQQQPSGVPAPHAAYPAPSAYRAVRVPAGGAVSPHWLPTPTRAYAGFWLRFLAHLIDGVIVGGVLIALLIPVAMTTGIGAGLHNWNPGEPPSPAMIFAFVGSIWIFILIGIVGGWIYYAYCESSEWQATPGKKALNLTVTDLDGNRVSFGRASGRYFAKLISNMIPFGVGYVVAGFTEKKQAVHDMIASCLVLRS